MSRGLLLASNVLILLSAKRSTSLPEKKYFSRAKEVLLFAEGSASVFLALMHAPPPRGDTPRGTKVRDVYESTLR